MHLYVSPESPWTIRAAAQMILVTHIGAAGVGLLSGAGALVLQKGGRGHRLAGNVFFVSMLVMSAIGTCVAPFLPQRGSIIGGAFTFYLVATAWATVRRKAGTVGIFEIGSTLFALAIAAAGVTFGIKASNSPSGILDGTPSAPYFVFSAISGLAAALDLRMVLRRGIVGAHRIVRHLWRMCVALLITVFSFFLGQSQIFPAFIRDSSVLYVPEVAVLVLLIFWMLRVSISNRYKEVTTYSQVRQHRGARPSEGA
jgi:hypothetical protein